METKRLLRQINKHKTKILETEKAREEEERLHREFLINNVTGAMKNVKDLIQVANVCIESHIDISPFFAEVSRTDSFGFTKRYQGGPVLSLSAYFMNENTLNWYSVRGNEEDPFLNDSNLCFVHFLEHLPVFEVDFYQYLDHILEKYDEIEPESEFEC